jgi:hypothetical protein
MLLLKRLCSHTIPFLLSVTRAVFGVTRALLFRSCHAIPIARERFVTALISPRWLEAISWSRILKYSSCFSANFADCVHFHSFNLTELLHAVDNFATLGLSYIYHTSLRGGLSAFNGCTWRPLVYLHARRQGGVHLHFPCMGLRRPWGQCRGASCSIYRHGCMLENRIGKIIVL